MATLKGLSFPLRFSGRGSFATSTGGDKIKENIKAIVLTSVGERVMNPKIGTMGLTHVFQNMSEGQISLLKHHIKLGIETGESRVTVVDLNITQDTPDGLLLVELTFKVNTQTEFENLAFNL